MRNLLQLRPQAVPRFDVLGYNDDLPIVWVWHLHVESEDETNRALPDVRRPTVDVMISDEMSLKAIHLGSRRGNRGVLRQGEVNDKFAPGRRRKELLLNELHSKQ